MARQWPNSYFCPLCRRNLETADHLLLSALGRAPYGVLWRPSLGSDPCTWLPDCRHLPPPWRPSFRRLLQAPVIDSWRASLSLSWSFGQFGERGMPEFFVRLTGRSWLWLTMFSTRLLAGRWQVVAILDVASSLFAACVRWAPPIRFAFFASPL